MSVAAPCPLCLESGGEVLWAGERCRIVLVDDADYPGFCRVIWQHHVAEMTDLSIADRMHLMEIVFKLEAAVRVITGAHKINLASLGNVVPHLHWHVIPRWRDDCAFPNTIWGRQERKGAERMLDRPGLSGQLQRELSDVI